MRFVLSVLVLVAATPAVALDKRPKLSWGKAGVSLETYRADALKCGQQGWNHDVSGTETAEILQRASRQVDNLLDSARTVENAQSIAQTVRSARPEVRREEVRQMLLATVADCLTGLGYRQFALTSDQQTALDDLKPGSDERRAYLHRLAADPAVLAAQSVAASR